LGGWPDLINTMLENIQTNNAVLKQSTLQAVGFVCEAIVRNNLIEYL
jgi:importin subunit beta-1